MCDVWCVMYPYLSLDVTQSGVLKSDTGGEERGEERGVTGNDQYWQLSLAGQTGPPDLGLDSCDNVITSVCARNMTEEIEDGGSQLSDFLYLNIN